jgi:hypothetical protein
MTTPPHEYIPDGPVGTAPYLGYCPPEVRQEAFCAVLEGVEMGAYDRRIIAWPGRGTCTATSAKDGPGFRAAEGQGAGCGAAPAPDGGHSLPLAEPGTRGECLVEPDRALRLADLGHQVGLPWSQHRPRPPPSPLPEACGRPGQQRRLFRAALRERQPANATRHSAMLRLMWIARLRSSASSRSARASASGPPAPSTVPSCTRDQAARQERLARAGTPATAGMSAAMIGGPAEHGPGSGAAAPGRRQ